MSATAEELAKFNREDWWQESGAFAPLHRINPLRLEWLQRYTNLAGKKLLDVGCGGGILAEALAKKSAHVCGIDLAPSAISTAKQHAADSGLQIDYREQDLATHIQQGSPAYDVITCMEMLEHCADPQTVVLQMAEIVRPGGWLFLSTFNRNALSFLQAIVAAEYILKLLPRGTHDWEKFITPATLSQWLRNAGLEVMGINGLSYLPFVEMYFITNDSKVNYMLAARKPHKNHS